MFKKLLEILKNHFLLRKLNTRIMWGPYFNPIPDNVIDEAKAALLAQDEEE